MLNPDITYCPAFQKRIIIYKLSTKSGFGYSQRALRTTQAIYFLYSCRTLHNPATSFSLRLLFIRNLYSILCHYFTVVNVVKLDTVLRLEVWYNNQLNNKTMNPIYLIKQPHPYHYLPENNTVYYCINTALRPSKQLYLDGFRNCFSDYEVGNCWGTNGQAEVAADLTRTFWDGLHFIFDSYPKPDVGFLELRLRDYFQDTATLMDESQQDLFPEIKPVRKEKIGIIEYKKAIFK